MRILIIIAACCLVYVSAECGDLERLKVKTQWEQVYGITAASREELGLEVWDYIFDHHPEVMETMTRVRPENIHSHQFHAHVVRVFGGLDICISLLHDKETLNSQLSHLNEQHAERDIKPEYFDFMWEGLSHAIPKHAKRFDQDAWHDCYYEIAAGISKDL